MDWNIQSAERTKLSSKNSITAKLSNNEKEIKAYPNKQKLREFVTTVPVLQEMLKRVPQAEVEECKSVTQSHMKKYAQVYTHGQL